MLIGSYPPHGFSKVTQVCSSSACAFVCMHVAREGGRQRHDPSSHLLHGPWAVSISRGARSRAGQQAVSLDRDGCQRAAAGPPRCFARNGTASQALRTRAWQHFPIGRVPQTCACRLLPLLPFLACMGEFSYFPVALFSFAHAGVCFLVQWGCSQFTYLA